MFLWLINFDPCLLTFQESISLCYNTENTKKKYVEYILQTLLQSSTQMLGDDAKKAEAEIEAGAKEKAILTARLLDSEAEVQLYNAAVHTHTLAHPFQSYSYHILLRSASVDDSIHCNLKYDFLCQRDSAGEQVGAEAAAGHRNGGFPLVRYNLIVASWIASNIKAQI